MESSNDCPLCLNPGGPILWQHGQIRVIKVDDKNYPGFTRVVWQNHVAEMTQLPAQERRDLMAVVWIVEQAQRQFLHPDKINLAQFGNIVPHLHWHVIARWRSDRHFPEAIWADAPARAAVQEQAWLQQKSRIEFQLPAYHEGLVQMLAQHAGSATHS